jgi:hypothetical protein
MNQTPDAKASGYFDPLKGVFFVRREVFDRLQPVSQAARRAASPLL